MKTPILAGTLVVTRDGVRGRTTELVVPRWPGYYPEYVHVEHIPQPLSLKGFSVGTLENVETLTFVEKENSANG